MRPLLALLLLLGCEADPVAPEDRLDSGRGEVPFADALPLLDGVVVRADSRPPLPDGAPLDDAGNLCRTGRVRGTVCAPNEAPIVGARIAAATRDCDGNEITVFAESGPGGRFQLVGLAPGLTRITINAGQFVSRADVEVLPDTVVPINGDNEKLCFGSNSTRLAVIGGEYDRIQEVLDGLELSYTLVCGDARDDLPARQLLLDRDALAQFEVLFVNCGSGINLRATNGEITRLVQNLRWFVRRGGSIYVSDLAADFVEKAWPERVRFTMTTASPSEESACCVCGDCSAECVGEGLGMNRCGAETTTIARCWGGAGVGGGGPPGLVPGATVEADFLRDALGSDTVDLFFNLGGWIRVASVTEEVNVLVHANGEPMMVQFEPEEDGGRVTYTSFHNHAQATGEMRRILEALVFRL